MNTQNQSYIEEFVYFMLLPPNCKIIRIVSPIVYDLAQLLLPISVMHYYTVFLKLVVI